MGLTYRKQKGSALTITELDNNFAYFTGSHAVTGSLVVTGSFIVTGSFSITGCTEIASYRPLTSSISNFTMSAALCGYSVLVGNDLTASIQTNAISSVGIGTEVEFLCTQSTAHIVTGSGVTMISGNEFPLEMSFGGNAKFKKIDTDTWFNWG